MHAHTVNIQCTFMPKTLITLSSIHWCKAFWIKKQFSSGYKLSAHEASFQVRTTIICVRGLEHYYTHWYMHNMNSTLL